VADYIIQLPKNQKVSTFRLLESEQAIKVFEYLPVCAQEELLSSLPKEQVLQIMEAISPDTRACLFDELPDEVALKLQAQLSEAEQQATAMILDYPEGTAGRVMTTEYVRLEEDLTVGEALSKICLSDRDKETIYYAYVTDENCKLVQIVSLRQMLFSIPDVLIKDIASTRVVKARTDMPQEEVAQLMKRYDLLALPVVDQQDRLVGIVTIDDVVDILEEEATEDFQKFAGVRGGDEDVLASPLVTITKRLPWLLGVMVLYIGSASAIRPSGGSASLSHHFRTSFP
jgi:magnesium transporter